MKEAGRYGCAPGREHAHHYTVSTTGTTGTQGDFFWSWNVTKQTASQASTYTEGMLPNSYIQQAKYYLGAESLRKLEDSKV